MNDAVQTPRVAVVTGAGSGIGRATALRFVRGGCHVLAVGRRAEPLLETAALAGGSEQVTTAALDIAAVGAMDDAVAQLVEARGCVDALVANAGVNPQRADALETTDEAWDETLRVNLTGLHRSCRAVLPHMIAQKHGAIVATGSVSGQVGMAERAAYGPTKAGVIQYARNLAIDYAKHGIRANSINPAFVVTDMTRDWLESRPEGVLEQIVSAHPLGLGTPDDVANAAWFLSTGESRWITGVDLSVDGGFSAH